MKQIRRVITVVFHIVIPSCCGDGNKVAVNGTGTDHQVGANHDQTEDTAQLKTGSMKTVHGLRSTHVCDLKLKI